MRSAYGRFRVCTLEDDLCADFLAFLSDAVAQATPARRRVRQVLPRLPPGAALPAPRRRYLNVRARARVRNARSSLRQRDDGRGGRDGRDGAGDDGRGAGLGRDVAALHGVGSVAVRCARLQRLISAICRIT